MSKREWSSEGAQAVFDAVARAMRSAGPAERSQVLRALEQHGDELRHAFVEAPSSLHTEKLLGHLRQALLDAKP